MGRLFWRKP